MVYFVGAGPGAPDLITVRGQELLKRADIIIYAGSLVNAQLLKAAPACCLIYNSAVMTLEEVVEVMVQGEREGKTIVRLHTGDPSLYGAIREQMDRLEEAGIAFEVCPGVSSFCGAAASLQAEYTLPGVSQTVIITRMEGTYPGAGEGAAEKPGSPWKHSCPFPEHRTFKAGKGRASGGRPFPGYPLPRSATR